MKLDTMNNTLNVTTLNQKPIAVNVNKANQELKPEPELSKVEMIKQGIENGSYKIDLDKLANKIADELL